MSEEQILDEHPDLEKADFQGVYRFAADAGPPPGKSSLAATRIAGVTSASRVFLALSARRAHGASVEDGLCRLIGEDPASFARPDRLI